MFLRNLNAPTYTYYDDYESETTVRAKPTVGGKPTVTDYLVPTYVDYPKSLGTEITGNTAIEAVTQVLVDTTPKGVAEASPPEAEAEQTEDDTSTSTVESTVSVNLPKLKYVKKLGPRTEFHHLYDEQNKNWGVKFSWEEVETPAPSSAVIIIRRTSATPVIKITKKITGQDVKLDTPAEDYDASYAADRPAEVYSKRPVRIREVATGGPKGPTPLGTVLVTPETPNQSSTEALVVTGVGKRQ
jgi:hypothetical protein